MNREPLLKKEICEKMRLRNKLCLSVIPDTGAEDGLCIYTWVLKANTLKNAFEFETFLNILNLHMEAINDGMCVMVIWKSAPTDEGSVLFEYSIIGLNGQTHEHVY